MRQLDIKDTLSIMKYGTDVQENFAGLSDCAFSFLRNTDLEEVGDLLSDMLEFFKADRKISEQETEELCKLVDEMSSELQKHHTHMIMDCEALEQFCVANSVYVQEITEAVMVAKEGAEQLKNDRSSDVRVRSQALEKRIKELELTKTVCGNFNNQMKLVQSNEAMMAQKIQSTLVNGLAMWKSSLFVNEKTEEIVQTREKNLMDSINDILSLQRQGMSVTRK